jgi:hypothetical protein
VKARAATIVFLVVTVLATLHPAGASHHGSHVVVPPGQPAPRLGPSSLYPDPTLPYAAGALTSDGPVSAASISSKERPLVSKPMNQ